MPTFEDAYLPKTKPDEESLLSLGFEKEGEDLVFRTDILDGAFHLTVRVSGSEVTTSLIEADSGEPYELYRIESAHGDYVGSVRDAVKEVLLNIRAHCYPVSWTKIKQPEEIIAAIKERYGDELEYPWEDYDFAIIRRQDTQKWYALFMYLPVSKVGIDEDREEVILNISRDGSSVDHKVFYPAYHMTKKTWVSMVLDGSVPTEEVLGYIEESYQRANKGKKR